MIFSDALARLRSAVDEESRDHMRFSQGEHHCRIAKRDLLMLLHNYDHADAILRQQHQSKNGDQPIEPIGYVDGFTFSGLRLVGLTGRIYGPRGLVPNVPSWPVFAYPPEQSEMIGIAERILKYGLTRGADLERPDRRPDANRVQTYELASAVSRAQLNKVSS